MFTGLVEEIGTIISKNIQQNGVQWGIKTSTSFMQDVKIGDSISVAGICQTVTSMTKDSFYFYSSPTTMQITNLKNYHIQTKINLEKALMIGQRLGGHFVYGHIEVLGIVQNILIKGDAITLNITIPEQIKYLVVKTGSIAIDGVSLTIADYNFPIITLQVIPHTWEHTTLKLLKLKSLVNIETDALAKYIQQINHWDQDIKENNIKNVLINNGFIK